jgi:hypothetical protein
MQTRAMKALFSVSNDNKPYDPNRQTITITKPAPALLPSGVAMLSAAGYDDEEWADEDDFETPAVFGMGEVPEMGRTLSPVGESKMEYIPSPAPLLLTFTPPAEVAAPVVVVDPEPVSVVPAPVIEEPKFKASGNLAKDLKAVKAAQTAAQSRLFETLKKLSLEDAKTLRDLLDEYITEQEETQEDDLQPA